ncbi:MAG: class I SAM-dependent methyltransferase [Candidatus Riflebacteria bacterium HGW-Riflebacteria-2]|nr:MAG: class I SAM-dependent methyltransferase [Candidatus Riflebacteria bacterium HGW-Riflebacteria-2]
MLTNRLKYICINCHQQILSAQQMRELVMSEATEMIRCSHCSNEYSLIKFIPRFVPGENYADSFGFQWNRHRKTQLDSFSGLDISKRRVEDATAWPADLSGQCILEAGSGAGRFTEVLVKTGAEIYSFDYSTAVDANYLNNGHNKNLHLFQGDIFKIPFAPESFDKVICLGVIQHTPDPAQAFASLAKQVKPGGELVIDVYRDDLLARLQWKYLLRPFTKRIEQQKLYRLIARLAPTLVPVARVLRKIAGRAGARLVPIVEFSYLGLSAELNMEWAILDTFDMLSPEYDLPQSLETVQSWFAREGFVDVNVRNGLNGVVGKGVKPAVG